MKLSSIHIIWISIGLGLIAPPTLAERNLVPSLESVPDICPQRPDEPEWMQNIPLRDAYHRVLVQDIYRAQSMAQIVATGSCPCETRFPTWDAAESTFRESHVNGGRSEMLLASDTYNRRANDLRPEAQAICEAVGNW
jgi:hypothetical protein